MNAKDFSKNVITNSLKDIKVELDEEFDRNFERKAFFSSANAWAKKRHDDGKGSLLVRSGALRRSISSRVSGDQLVYSSSELYATIHNEGGEIEVTAKMKRFFWAMYYQASGGVVYSVKMKRARDTKRNRQLSAEATFFKRMALKKVGDKIKIPKRQFIGHSPEVERIVREVVEDNIQEYLNNLAGQLTKR